MALANATWDDYRTGRAAARATDFRGVLVPALLAVVAFALCLAAGFSVLYVVESHRASGPTESPAAVARRYDRAVAALPLLERNAASFLRDSLTLGRRCAVRCAPSAFDVAEAQKLGGFAHAPLATGLALQPTFSAPVADLPAPPPPVISPVVVTQTPVAPAEMPVVPTTAPVTVTETSVAPPPVHIAPVVVVPLPPVVLGSVAPPVPAPRPDRVRADSPAPATTAPLQQALLPPDTRIAPPMAGPAMARNDGVAVYDISAATVYLPDGQRLEAHSGLGYMVDNPRYADRRNTGPTPPNTYKLVQLENRFYGVEALRLEPIDGINKYGRDGLLTHTYLLRGRPAQSNGCVAFKDYDRFLAAFKRGEFKRLVVVASLSGPPIRLASTGDST